jgi:hypothetical protein
VRSTVPWDGLLDTYFFVPDENGHYHDLYDNFDFRHCFVLRSVYTLFAPFAVAVIVGAFQVGIGLR